ncbi:MAG: hypothetical protein IH983_05105 [Planctomycetes bacterium]|nr:hypothetical protein [Planctomycetota bacterium]
MRQVNRSFATIRLVGTILTILVVIGLGAYFLSDVFRTKVGVAYDQFAHWTPENIAKDPAGYLAFCQTETVKTLEELKAREIAVSQNRAGIERMHEDAQEKVVVGTKALGELKQTYRRAAGTDAWPIRWRGQNRDKDWSKRQIVALYKEIESQEVVVGKCEAGLKNLDNQVVRIQDIRAKAQEQLSEIRANQQLIKIEKLSTELTDRLAAMKGAVEATVRTTVDFSKLVNLDDLAAEAELEIDEQEFESIMKRPD